MNAPLPFVIPIVVAKQRAKVHGPLVNSPLPGTAFEARFLSLRDADVFINITQKFQNYSSAQSENTLGIMGTGAAF